MKRLSNISILFLAALMLFSAAGCQSTASDEAPAAVAPAPVQEEIPEVAEAETAEPVPDSVPVEAAEEEASGIEAISVGYSYAGYELSAAIERGQTVIVYPGIVTEEEAEAFFAFENARYGLAEMGVAYSFDGPGKAVITYPDGINPETVKAELDRLVDDLVAYITPVPESIQEVVSVPLQIVKEYSYAGYNLTAVIEEGRTELSYPAAVADADAEAFISLENERYGLADMGVRYVLEGEGKAVFTYPEDFSADAVAAELDRLVDDLIAYITTSVPAEAEEVAVVKEAQPVVKEYSYAEYSLTAVIEEGRTELSYPAAVADADAEAFIALENERYGLAGMGVRYVLEGEGKAVFTYPEDYSADAVAAELDRLVDDLIAYITTPVPAEAEEVAVVEEAQPVVKEYSYAEYSLTAVIEEGKTELSYPAAVADADAEAFIALENERYGLADMGVRYVLEGDGKAVFTYPEDYSADAVAVELDRLVDDLIAYITTPVPAETEDVSVQAVADVPAPAVPEAVSYPFGIEPIVKAKGDDDGFYLYIVHTNDVHGRIVPEEDGSMGYAKLSTLLSKAREYTDDILLLDGGDTLHGTNLANMFEGQTVLEIMNSLGYDAMAPGNHDFNYGAERLEEAAAWAEKNASFRILSANITDESGAFAFQPYQIFDFNGFKVCVIGVTTPDTKTKSHPKNTIGLDFMSDAVVENAQEAIDLAHELADFVVVLGHVGVVPDGDSGLTSEIICQSLDGIDLFVDAHSHTVMDGGEVVNGTMIVSTGQYMNNVGIVEVKVEADGDAEITDAFLLPASEVLDPSSGTILASFGITEVPADPSIDAYVEEKNAELDEMLGQVVADIPMGLNGERHDVRTKKTNLSALICEAMTAESGADFTIVNGGGIRASLEAGPVTLGDVNNVLPFTNIITVCEITPADVYAALEHGYSMLPEENGAFSQTDLRVVYSASAPVGERIRRVYAGDTLLDRNDTRTLYKVASNDFMAAGGDGYTMFGRVLSEGSMLNEVFCDYLAQLYPAE